MYTGFRVKYQLSWSDFLSLNSLDRFFEKSSNIKIFINVTSSGSRDVPCGRSGMTKLTVVFFFATFANVPVGGYTEMPQKLNQVFFLLISANLMH